MRLSRSSSGHHRGFAGVEKKTRLQHFFESAGGAIPERVAPSSFLRARNSVDWWAGIGGGMAVKKQSSQKKQKEQKVVGETREQTTAKKDPCLGCDLDCTACKVDGAKTLRLAACQTLKKASTSITKKLATKAKAGDANSTKLLLLLSETQPAKDGAKKKKRGRSAAQELADEPEWSEDETETLAETGAGNQKADGNLQASL